jgi:C1A family cysteine protease
MSFLETYQYQWKWSTTILDDPDNNEGFIIRNSWGKLYADNGYAVVKYKDFNKILECWTIID